MRRFVLLLGLFSLAAASSGCSLIPEVVHQPVVHNPFPQLTRVAVAPFFNLSAEPGADGRQFALAYFNELQSIQGFEVVALGVTERAIKEYHLDMSSPADVRRLAQILQIDAVAIGAITDYTPYYPPRVGLTVEWYAACPCYHPIPAGYGLPWGTPEEEYIPAPLVFEAEMALARAQMKAAATPKYDGPPQPQPVPNTDEPGVIHEHDPLAQPAFEAEQTSHRKNASLAPQSKSAASKASPGKASPSDKSGTKPSTRADGKVVRASAQEFAGPAGPPPGWPDASAFIPAPPCVEPPACQPTNEPVMKHTQIYNGNDGELTAALANYVFFQDDARRGSWQGYLQRSDDFIRFCCRMHLYEMLSARGGSGETRVVWRWPTDR